MVLSEGDHPLQGNRNAKDPLGEVPPTGKRIEVDGLIFDRVAAGKVIERWEQTVMLKQLGLA